MKVGYIPALTFPPKVRPFFPRAHASPALSHGPLQAGGHRQDRDSRYEQTADAWRLSGDLVVVTPAVTRSKSFACRWSAMRGAWIDARSWSTQERNLVASRVEKDQGSAEALWSPIVKTSRLVVREMGDRRSHRSSVVIKIMFVKSNDFD